MPTPNITPAVSHTGTATLETCEAIQITFNDGLTSVIVWKGRPTELRPEKGVKRLRDLRPGDVAWFRGERLVVREVGVFR